MPKVSGALVVAGAHDIRAIVLRTAFDHRERKIVDIEWTGQTARELLEDPAVRWPQWAPSMVLVACVDGTRLEEPDLDRPLRPGVEIVIGPAQHPIPAVVLVAINISLLVLTSVASYLMARRIKSLAPPERGDETSATYAGSGMASEYRAGFPVPVLLGEHDVGGQVIYCDVAAGTPVDFVTMILAISDGRIDSVGGVTGNAFGEVNGLGGFAGGGTGGLIPTDIRVNGNRFDATNPTPGVRVFLRLGEITQTPIGFPGVRTTQLVGQDLPDINASAIATIATTEVIEAVSVYLRFPAGLYTQGASGAIQNYTVVLDVAWAPSGSSSWVPAVTRSVISARLGSFAVPISFAVGVEGPIQIRVIRQTVQGGSMVSSLCNVAHIVYSFPHTFSYPRLAQIGMIFDAGIMTGRPNVVVRARGNRVRVYDGTIGSNAPSTSRYWSVPVSGDPYFGIWSYPPGQNPAWLLAEFLTARWGLGEYIDDAQIDWENFRDWADFCDQNALVSGVPEAAFQCDYVIDAPTPAFDAMAAICACGRAVPYFDGDRVRVRYQFSASHGRGTNSVAAKVRTQVFSTANLTDFAVDYFDTSARPGVRVLEILNKAKDYAHDPIPVEDPNGGFNDPTNPNPLRFTKEQEQFHGVTRESQARREGLFLHDAARLIRSRLSFTCGPEALAAEVGDVVGVQHDALRPYSTEAFAYRLSAAVSASTTIRLDHDVTLVGGETYAVVLRVSTGSIVERTITSGAGSYPAGTALTISGGAITALKSAPVDFGRYISGTQRVVKDYEIVSIGLAEEHVRQVVAVDWVPSIHTLPDVGEEIAGGVDETLIGQSTALESEPEAAPLAAALRVVPTGSPGRQLVSWDHPDGTEGHAARVLARLSGSDGTFWDLGESRTGELETVNLEPGQTYEIAVAIADRHGTFHAIGEATSATIRVDEFPPLGVPSLTRAEALPKGDGLLVRWQPLDAPGLDYYEVRVGPAWAGAQVLGRTRDPFLFLEKPPPKHSANPVKLLIAARMKHGLYSTRPFLLALPTWAPDGGLEQIAFDVDPSTHGTMSDLTWNSTTKELRISDGKMVGTFTTTGANLDVGYTAEALWRFGFWTRQEDPLTCGQATFGCGSGEARWRTVLGRDPSLAAPGWEMDETIAEIQAAGIRCGNWPQRLAGTYLGQTGHHVAAKLDVRYDVNGDGSYEIDWQSYRGERRRARVAQYRLTLRRSDVTRKVYAGGLRAEMHI